MHFLFVSAVLVGDIHFFEQQRMASIHRRKLVHHAIQANTVCPRFTSKFHYLWFARCLSMLNRACPPNETSMHSVI